jgi:uncharacterized protein YndB with AHSA1/START domain
MANHVATAETEIAATPDEVWKALTEPKLIEEYMFGTHVETDWKPGSRIVWKGDYDGKRYEDKGEILDVQPGKRLELTHYSPLSGDEDRPENYHTVVYELEGRGATTRVALSQDGNADDEAAEHSRSNWEKVLSGLKQTVESR